MQEHATSVVLERLDTLAIVEEGSFEDAAAVLGITPSAVSQRSFQMDWVHEAILN